MKNIEKEIIEIVNRETSAWDNKDVDKLMTVFHPDMVWPWPRDAKSHDPLDWTLELGRYNYDGWKKGWQDLFDSYDLVHNRRKIIKIEISKESDGAFAVVDVDTLWRNKSTNEDFLWNGRACKVYTKLTNGWKLIMHTGLLEY